MKVSNRVSLLATRIAMLAVLIATVACTNLMATEYEPRYVDASAREIIEKAVVTSSILPDGRVVLITRDGKIIDVKELPPLSLPDEIEGGTNINVNTIAVFAIQGSPVEVRGNFGFGPVCYVFDDQTGAYLGSCPASKYR